MRSFLLKADRYPMQKYLFIVFPLVLSTLSCHGVLSISDNVEVNNQTGYCGNGIMEEGENCDGLDFGEKDCLSEGYDSGALACSDECTLIRSGCIVSPDCGNGVLDPQESCDGTELNGETCSGLGYMGGDLGCSDTCDFDTAACLVSETCGNGIREFGEQCDGEDLNSLTCISAGYFGGLLSCTENCILDYSSCEAAGICGDGEITPEYEECDGANLDGKSCESEGYHGGDLECTQGCQLNFAECALYGSCGDGTIQNAYEECDGTNFNGVTCENLGYHGGTVQCTDTCQLDLSDCEATGMCGDGTIDALYETCDGTNFDGVTCESLGFQVDSLICQPDCQADHSQCRERWVQVSVGNQFACGIRESGTLWCWGSNYNYQLGLGVTGNQSTPQQVGTGTDWVSVTAGAMHACAMKTSGIAYCWGENSSGQLGVGSNQDQHTPSPVLAVNYYRSLSAGFYHTCAVQIDGTLWCWGQNSYSQVGQSDMILEYEDPEQVGSGNNWATVHAGAYHTCARTDTDILYCWGRNDDGQMGIGYSSAEQQDPVQIQGALDWAQVAPSVDHSCGLRGDGTLWCWGEGIRGQLGQGSTTDRDYPVQVGTASTWLKVFTGEEYSCGILSPGELWCWGANYNGNLGNGSLYGNSLTPVRAGTASDWESGDGGQYSTCTITITGSLYCFGENGSGQLGIGTTTSVASPQRVLVP
ncbi:hypothetical protein KKF84_05735 [Myxococcota bacterium]|nr:hypothetical protein [Myxococcota bacterium]MBU1534799.1 hypothetical protein [Myxococcota bacterium]